MRKIFSAVAGLFLAVGLTSMGASASASGAIGCGGGNSAEVPCNGQSLGTVTQSGSTFSGSADVFLTSVTGLPSEVSSLEVFTPDTDQFDFSFSSVASASGGTFTFTDLTEPGVLTVSGTAIWKGTPPSGTPLTGTLDLSLVATSYSFSYGGLSAGGSIHVSGNAALTLDPGTITSMTGSVGLPNLGGGSTTTPEPGTLLLLGSGLTALGFIRRKFTSA